MPVLHSLRTHLCLSPQWLYRRPFHINVTALPSQSIDLRAHRNALGHHQLNLCATVDGVIRDWLLHFYDLWSDFCHLSILSFHNTRGTQAFDTTDAANTAILLPGVDGAVTDCVRMSNSCACSSLSVFWILSQSQIQDPPPFELSDKWCRCGI